MDTLDSPKDRYFVQGELGKGGYSVVKSAIRDSDGQRVAVKIVNRENLQSSDESSLAQEMHILQMLNHKGIVKAYDFWEDPETFFIVLEYMDGGELFDRIVKKKYFFEMEARDIARSILEAIAHCHRHHIAHRDLKPENLLLGNKYEDAEVKLADFGFAVVCRPGNLPHDQCGTPTYIAPEILKNEPHDMKVDMWSFGVILYIILRGYPPFYGPTNREVFQKIKKGDYVFHQKEWSTVSNEAKDLITHLLTVDPLKRYSADQALAHPWFHTAAEHLPSESIDIKQLRKFQIRRKFRAFTKAMIAVSRMRKAHTRRASTRKDSSHADFASRFMLTDTVLQKEYFYQVRIAVDAHTNTQYRVKISHEKLMEEKETALYLHEIDVLKALPDHPNIVKLVGFFDETDEKGNRILYQVSEIVNGGELFDRIVKKQYYSEEEARDIVRSMLEAIAHMHTHGVVHRDIKPENIFFADRGPNAKVKLGKFGCATKYTHDSSVTGQCGTRTYIAPEILSNKPYGPAVDMWSFGVVLYILLGGYPPFYGPDIFKNILRGCFQFEYEYWDGVSEEAKDLIKRLLTVDPRKRLTAMQALDHVWLQMPGNLLCSRTLTTSTLRRMQIRGKLRGVVRAITALNKIQKLITYHPKPLPDLPHTFTARYNLTGMLLGEGGYSKVKLCISKADKRHCAVKIIKKSSLSKNDTASLVREVSILKALSHNHIIRCIDFFDDDKEHYFLVMECVDGGELFDRIVKKKHYNEKEARDLVRCLLGAIQYCHKQSIVHRDIKPENLLMASKDNDYDVKLADFGFAIRCDGENIKEQCGTPGYLAPEVLKNVHYGLPVDMWSFGVVLFILLGGYSPFYDKNTQVMYQRILHACYEFSPKYWGNVSVEAKDLISKLLIIDPAKRLTVQQALAHPWLHTPDKVLASRDLSRNQGALKKYLLRMKVRKCLWAIVFTHRMKRMAEDSHKSSFVWKAEDETRPATAAASK